MARLTRWGNSEGGMRIPKSILAAAGLKVGDEVLFRLKDDGTIVLISKEKRALAEGNNPESRPSKSTLEW